MEAFSLGLANKERDEPTHKEITKRMMVKLLFLFIILQYQLPFTINRRLKIIFSLSGIHYLLSNDFFVILHKFSRYVLDCLYGKDY